jgi:hypothetical protein
MRQRSRSCSCLVFSWAEIAQCRVATPDLSRQTALPNASKGCAPPPPPASIVPPPPGPLPYPPANRPTSIQARLKAQQHATDPDPDQFTQAHWTTVVKRTRQTSEDPPTRPCGPARLSVQAPPTSPDRAPSHHRDPIPTHAQAPVNHRPHGPGDVTVQHLAAEGLAPGGTSTWRPGTSAGARAPSPWSEPAVARQPPTSPPPSRKTWGANARDEVTEFAAVWAGRRPRRVAYGSGASSINELIPTSPGLVVEGENGSDDVAQAAG